MTRWFAATLTLAMVAAPVAGQNLLSNPSFDSGMAGWTLANTTWVSNDGNPNGSGPGCVEVTAPMINGGLYATWQAVSVTAGSGFSISGWAFVPDTADNIAAGAEFAINWLSGTASLGYSWFATSHVRGQWGKIIGQASAPAGATSAQVMFGVRGPNSGSGTPRARWDDVYFGPPQTEPSTADYFVLAAGYGPGKNGTFWTTDVSIYNPTSATLQVQATFFQGMGDNSGAQPASLGSLAAGATMNVANIVQAAGGSGTGAVRLHFAAPAGSPTAAAVVTARTWTPWSGVTVGQGATASPGTSGSARAVSGLVQDTAFRTNVGVFNATGAVVQARVRIFNAQGVAVYDQTWSLGPFGQSQVGLPNIGINAIDAGTMRVDGAGVIAYATPVDNGCGDAAYLEARPIE
jgi:hypothetical protein